MTGLWSLRRVSRERATRTVSSDKRKLRMDLNSVLQSAQSAGE